MDADSANYHGGTGGTFWLEQPEKPHHITRTFWFSKVVNDHLKCHDNMINSVKLR